ncbi:hypothetical protein ACIBL5_31950 [Streptomyces sp. NPDC050516]|uniref:hypothetical protein n=1 Tax=Streptomyces sp. NPDC050516 TaxID=3365621 RepID=UPI0037994BCC
MSALIHPRIGQGAVLLVVTLAAALELAAVRLDPPGIRAVASGFLFGAAVADAPDLNRLYAAWILATHDRDTAWISGRLSLPHDIAALLVCAARTRHDH